MAGAEPVIGDALDPYAVMAAVRHAQPDAIIHQLTTIPTRLNMRKFDRDFELTNRLRTEGIDHLLAAARAVGVRRFVAQSFAGWPYARHGGSVKTEQDPLDSNPTRATSPQP
jgi:nucleoside-diphosphate-sugar epimerase